MTAGGLIFLVAVFLLLMWLLYKSIMMLFRFEIDLRQYIFNSDGQLIWRILLFFLWVPLALFGFLFLCAGVWACASLVKDGYQWLNED